MRVLHSSKRVAIVLALAALGYAQAQGTARSAAGAPEAGFQRDSLQEQIVAKERAGLDALKTGDLTYFAASTADNAIFVDERGPATKSEVVEHTAAFRLHDYTMTDVRFVPVSDDSGLIVYTLAESGASHGREFTAKVHVSALWQKREGKWQCVFSQETAAK